jgi:uncharacterized protein with von Willebrand factor type A (vWA) domain
VSSKPSPILFERQEARLAALDQLARNLWLGGLTNSIGELEPRLNLLAMLRQALATGHLPATTDWPWPARELADGLHQVFDRLGLPAYCKDQPELVDIVLMGLLFHLDFVVDYQDRGASEARAIDMALEAFSADWETRTGEFDELIEVFGFLPDGAKDTRWDQIHGLLQQAGWQDILRIRRQLEDLPDLARLIRSLGRVERMPETDEHSQRSKPVLAPATALKPLARTVHVPDLPGETRGIKRADRIARMLPVEAMLLGHPKLRLIWHARRAESTLLCYEDDDRMAETRLATAKVMQPQPGMQADERLEKGPILLCVDTSGSMQGGAEAVAKATVLEAMRTAHAQGRACHVFAFGGPDEILTLELGVDAAGIETVIRFLGQSFRGGTDICGPLELALAKIEETRWRQADLLIASDGEFGATPALVERLEQAKKAQGLRVQGILLGDRETIGLLEVVDDVFWVRDWRHFGTSEAASPVHSSSLTAMYFPGALRTPANRDKLVSGDTAMAAIRAGKRQSDLTQEERNS